MRSNMYQFTKLKIVFLICDECVSFNMTHVIKGPFIAEDRTRIKYNDMDFSSPLNKCSIMVKLSLSGKLLYKQNKTKQKWKPLHWKYSSWGWIHSCNRFYKKERSLLNMQYLPKLVLCYIYTLYHDLILCLSSTNHLGKNPQWFSIT